MSYPFQKAKSDQKEDRSLGKKTNKKGNKQKLQKPSNIKQFKANTKTNAYGDEKGPLKKSLTERPDPS